MIKGSEYPAVRTSSTFYSDLCMAVQGAVHCEPQLATDFSFLMLLLFFLLRFLWQLFWYNLYLWKYINFTRAWGIPQNQYCPNLWIIGTPAALHPFVKRKKELYSCVNWKGSKVHLLNFNTCFLSVYHFSQKPRLISFPKDTPGKMKPYSLFLPNSITT